MYYVAKKELNTFPFDQFYNTIKLRVNEALEDVPLENKLVEANKVRKVATASFLEKHDVKNNASWLMPQLASHISRLPIKKNELGKYDSTALYDAFRVDDFHRGILLLGTHHTRGDFIPKQYSPEYRNYSALVPLLLMPFKKFNDIKYSDWDTTSLHKLIDPTLWQAMNLDMEKPSAEELLELREIGLLVKSGKTEGTMRNPLTTHKLFGLPNGMGKIPWVAQAMMFQIWCAHPTQRSELMILDWVNWDEVPQPLINVDVIPEAPKTVKTTTEFPWDD